MQSSQHTFQGDPEVASQEEKGRRGGACQCPSPGVRACEQPGVQATEQEMKAQFSVRLK